MILVHLAIRGIAVQRKRRGAVGPLTAIMVIPMIAMVAMACDIGYIWRTEAELQNAADSAALAGCARLLDANVTLKTPTPILTGTSAYTTLLDSACANAVSTGQQYGNYHRGAGVTLAISTSDVEVGYIQDPTAASSTPAGTFQTGLLLLVNFPNAVRATARRDSSNSTGAFGLFFTRVFGVASAERSATATACLRGGTIPGFTKPAGGLLPIAMHEDVYKWLYDSTNPRPAGITDMDDYRVTTGVSKPPDNVSFHNNQGDGRKEAVIYQGKVVGKDQPEPGFDEIIPSTLAPGNFGLINLKNDPNSNATEIGNWILNGLSETDLATWGADGLVVPNPTDGLGMGGQTGLQSSQEDALKSIIGQPRIMPVFRGSVAGNGSNATYTVVGFVGVVIVKADLKGGNKEVIVQVTSVIESGAKITNTVVTGDPTFIYKGISLCR